MTIAENLSSSLMIPALIAYWTIMLVDWYRYAKGHRKRWLAIILFSGIFGYSFFHFSKDRA